MNNRLWHSTISPRESSRILGRLFFSVALWLAVVFVVMVNAAPTSTTTPLKNLNLLPGVVAKILPDGSLVLISTPDGPPLLSAEALPLTDTRRSRNRNPVPFTAVVVEGATGGQRGFSAHCDDDNDGATDEDQLDGIDNDGDGRVDEDFAAISDAMVVVHQDLSQGGGRAAHLEYYHWSYPHLRSTVFLAATGDPGLSSGGTYRVTLGSDKWREVTTTSDRHSLAGYSEPQQTRAFVSWSTRVGAQAGAMTCNPDSRLWVGVVVLNETQGLRPVLDGDALELPLTDEALPMAICVAESWLQLNHMLNETKRVWAGVEDQITGRKASWIASPLCAQCRLAPAPGFSWEQNAAGDILLTAHIDPGGNSALDPDLFVLVDDNAKRAYLGAPREIRWQSDKGQTESMSWACMNPAVLNRNQDDLISPYTRLSGLLDHQSSGQLQFVFSTNGVALLTEWAEISGSYLSGRSFRAPLKAKHGDAEPETSLKSLFFDQASGAETAEVANLHETILKSGDFNPKLSPDLFKGFPNPFRDVIQLKFKVPVTVGEAFIWDKNTDPPAGLDLMAAVPWRGGSPNISVKIYSINGQELLTLFSGTLGRGENTLHWSGTDSFGRQVASGTYFCKLQMDDWSVTRRLVYLR